MLRSNLEICCHTATYYAAFAYFYWWNGCIDSSGAQWLLGQDWLPAVHMYTLSKQLHLWHSPHYRAPTFAEDLRSNLKNVAIPGTGNNQLVVTNISSGSSKGKLLGDIM